MGFLGFVTFGNATPRLCLSEGTRWCLSPSGRPTPSVPHLSAGTHWGKGVGPTHEHFPASDNQDPHIVLTLLLKREGEVEGHALAAVLGVFPSQHCTTDTGKHSCVPAPPCSQVQVASVDTPCPRTSHPGCLTVASLPTQMLRADPHLHRSPWLIQAGPPCRQPHAHTQPFHPRNQKPPPRSRPGAQTIKATYLSLSFALAGAACILVGGPLCGLWDEHTDITQLCHSSPGQAAAGVCSGQEAGKGSGTACRVSVPLTTSTWTQRTARSPYPETFKEWISPHPTPSPPAWVMGGWNNSFLMLHSHAALS